MSTPGYSGRSLTEKLGLKPTMRAFCIGAPHDYRDWLSGVSLPTWDGQDADFLHVFLSSALDLTQNVERWRHAIYPTGMVWLSWPKKSSGVKTDLDDSVIRNFILQNGLVDIKVCAVSEVWSGLKCVVPIAQRGP
jgi:hypothetical protein